MFEQASHILLPTSCPNLPTVPSRLPHRYSHRTCKRRPPTWPRKWKRGLWTCELSTWDSTRDCNTPACRSKPFFPICFPLDNPSQRRPPMMLRDLRAARLVVLLHPPRAQASRQEQIRVSADQARLRARALLSLARERLPPAKVRLRRRASASPVIKL